jgi:amidase
VVLGRTNLPDLGLRVFTESSLHGITRNPWNLGHTAGGSSGGEAAALATGMTPLGLGNDIGGSLRNPAHCCGIASIKPSQGRVPAASVVPPEDAFLAAQLMATDGPMARRVADVRLGLSVIAGEHPRDPGSLPVPLDLPAPPSRRVTVMAEPPGGPTDPAVAAGVRRAADVLADAGYEVEEGVPPLFEEAIAVWSRWLLTEISVLMPLLRGLMGADGVQFLETAEQAIPPLDGPGLVATLIERRTVARRWTQHQQDAPLLLSPVWTQRAFPHGYDLGSAETGMEVIDAIRCVLPANLLGLPAAVVPVGVDGGLPHGVQIIGPRFQDLFCLAAAEAIEVELGVLTPIEPVSG